MQRVLPFSDFCTEKWTLQSLNAYNYAEIDNASLDILFADSLSQF